MSFQKIRKDAATVLEYVYLFLFGIVVLYTFLQKTTFQIPWAMFMRTAEGSLRVWCEWLIEPPYRLLGCTAALRCLIQRKYNWKTTLAAVGVLIVGNYLWHQNGYYRTILFAVLVAGAIGISYQRLIKLYFLIVSGTLLITVICAVTGLIENYTVVRDGNIRMFFGINAPTNFASFVYFQILCWWYLRKEKLTYKEVAGTAVLTVLLYIFCNTRTACILLLTVSVSMIWMKYRSEIQIKTGRPYQMNSLISGLCALAYPVLAIVMIGLTLLYSRNSVILSKIDTLITGRLSYGKKAFDIYGVSFFGKYIRLFGFDDGQAVSNYFYIDSSYVQMAVMFGLVMMVLLLLAFFIICEKAREQKDWIFLLVLVFAGLHSAIEPHLIEIQYCPFLLALLADTKNRNGLRLSEIFGRRAWIRG